MLVGAGQKRPHHVTIHFIAGRFWPARISPGAELSLSTRRHTRGAKNQIKTSASASAFASASGSGSTVGSRLQGIQIRVRAVASYQLLMRSTLDNFGANDDHDQVRHLDSRESV